MTGGERMANIFSFATSELSQDTMLCWLLQLAAPEETLHPLHEVGTRFVNFLYTCCDKKLPGEIQRCQVIKQDGHIDVQCQINSQDVILIEDKVGTKQHSDQLRRYQEQLQHSGLTILPVYIQTGDQCDYSEVINNGYSVVCRKDLLAFFASCNDLRAKYHSDLLEDYVSFLSEIEADVQSYKKLPISQWKWNSWKGFYSELKKQLAEGGWDYVSNPSGGFLGFWWHWSSIDECEHYLQLEQERLCFKICTDIKERQSEFKYKYHDLFVSRSQNSDIRLIKPSRLRSGSYMTVAILDAEYRICNENGIIDMGKTVEFLKRVMTFKDEAITMCDE